jgi:hypothetical protein
VDHVTHGLAYHVEDVIHVRHVCHVSHVN